MSYRENRRFKLEINEILNKINDTNSIMDNYDYIKKFGSSSKIRNELCCEYLATENIFSAIASGIKAGVLKIIEFIKEIYKKIISFLKRDKITSPKKLKRFNPIPEEDKKNLALQIKAFIVKFHIANALCEISDLSEFRDVNKITNNLDIVFKHKIANSYLFSHLGNAHLVGATISINRLSMPFKEINEALKQDLILPTNERTYLKDGIKNLSDRLKEYNISSVQFDTDPVTLIDDKCLVDMIDVFSTKFNDEFIAAYTVSEKEFSALSDKLKNKIKSTDDTDFIDTYSTYLKLIVFLMNIQKDMLTSATNFIQIYRLLRTKYGIFE